MIKPKDFKLTQTEKDIEEYINYLNGHIGGEARRQAERIKAELDVIDEYRNLVWAKEEWTQQIKVIETLLEQRRKELENTEKELAAKTQEMVKLLGGAKE